MPAGPYRGPAGNFYWYDIVLEQQNRPNISCANFKTSLLTLMSQCSTNHSLYQWQFQNLPPRENCTHSLDPGAVHCEPPRRTHSNRDLDQRKDIHVKENGGRITVHRHPGSIRLPARSECRTGHLDWPDTASRAGCRYENLSYCSRSLW